MPSRECHTLTAGVPYAPDRECHRGGGETTKSDRRSEDFIVRGFLESSDCARIRISDGYNCLIQKKIKFWRRTTPPGRVHPPNLRSRMFAYIQVAFPRHCVYCRRY